jgi:hypothetical protein
MQSGALVAAGRHHRHGVAARSRRIVRTARARRGRRDRSPFRRSETGEQSTTGRADPSRGRYRCRSDLNVRRADQTHPRIQTPTVEFAARGRALSGDDRPARRPRWSRLGATHRGDGRQSRIGVPHREIDHPPRPRHRPRGEQRPATRRQVEDGVPAELRRELGRNDRAGGEFVRADLHRRHRSLRHRQYAMAH